MADARWYSTKEKILLPAVLSRIKPDLVHFPHFNVPLLYPGKFVVTVHDLIKSDFKSASSTTRSLLAYMLKHLAYGLTIRRAISRAEAVFVPSNFVKKRIGKEFEISKKIFVTYEAADDFFVQASRGKISEGKEKQILSKYAIKKPYFLYVG